MEMFGNLYSLTFAESRVNLGIQSTHKNVYQLTNLSLAFPTIAGFSVKMQLMIGHHAAAARTQHTEPMGLHGPQDTVLPTALGNWSLASGPELATWECFPCVLPGIALSLSHPVSKLLFKMLA